MGKYLVLNLLIVNSFAWDVRHVCCQICTFFVWKTKKITWLDLCELSPNDVSWYLCRYYDRNPAHPLEVSMRRVKTPASIGLDPQQEMSEDSLKGHMRKCPRFEVETNRRLLNLSAEVCQSNESCTEVHTSAVFLTNTLANSMFWSPRKHFLPTHLSVVSGLMAHL